MRTNPYKALLSFMYYGDAKLAAFASAIIKAMTGNTNFPASADLLAALNTAQAAYTNALAIANDGSRMQVAEKNACKVNLLDALRNLNDMVNYVAQGDRVILLGSGFDVSKETVTPVVLEPAKNVVIKYGENSGQMDVAVKGVKGHKGLVFEYAVADETGVAATSAWVSQPSGTTSHTITDMPVGQKVLIRVGIAGPRKQLVYTEPVAKLVA
jgi:hypothetical protein